MQRVAQRAVIGLAFAYALVGVYLILGNWGFEDVDAYWDAAMRLRDGDPLYPIGQDPDSYRVYRYAPWFAWLWVPLTYLPQGPVEIGWGLLIGLAAAAVLVALVRTGRGAGMALAFVLTPWMLSLVQVGNIQPLVVAMLGFGVSRRSGPLWVGISASLKAVPIVWALVYLARREWPRLVGALVVFAVLSATFLLHDRSGYVTDPGRSGMSLYYNVGPAVWVVGAALCGAVSLVLAWRRSEWLWPALAVAAMFIAPRSHITYTTFLAVGLLNGVRDRIRAD